MRYSPSRPNHTINYNVSSNSALKTAASLMAVIIIALFSLMLVVGVAAEVMLRHNETAVINFFNRIIPEVKQAKLENRADQALLLQLEGILARLLQELPPESQLESRLVLRDNPTVNAYIYPNGTIVLNTGLTEILSSEQELAMVVAHELGHSVQRHFTTRLSRLASVYLLSSLLLLSNSPIADLAADFLLAMAFSYSREQEREADYFALDLLNKSYGNVAGATTFFEKIKEHETVVAGWSLFKTHPSCRERLSYLKERALEQGYQ